MPPPPTYITLVSALDSGRFWSRGSQNNFTLTDKASGFLLGYKYLPQNACIDVSFAAVFWDALRDPPPPQKKKNAFKETMDVP